MDCFFVCGVIVGDFGGVVFVGCYGVVSARYEGLTGFWFVVRYVVVGFVGMVNVTSKACIPSTVTLTSPWGSCVIRSWLALICLLTLGA